MSKNSICVPPNLITYEKDKELMHFGIPRRSGRYPWGSGERPYQGDGIAPRKKRNHHQPKLKRIKRKELGH